MAFRVKLIKKWKNLYGTKEYPINTILQVTPDLGSDLIRERVAIKYEGEYPPKSKTKMNLSQLNSNKDGST
jgi:hypothetical protein